MIIEFPQPDIITQNELVPTCSIEAQLDEILESLYQRLDAGATVEPGLLSLSMRRRPVRAVADVHRKVW